MKQENRPPRILYWKWDDSHIDSGSYRAGIDDLCERSCFDTVFICTHWCRDGLSTKKTHDAVLDACRLLALDMHGKPFGFLIPLPGSL